MIWHNQCHIGDCREILKSMVADGVRVQMCVTSPPYWGLRDYGTATWEGGDKECYHRRVSQGAGTRAGLAAAAERADGIHRNPENRTDKGGEHYIHYRDTCGLCGARRIDSQLGLEATPEEYIANMVEVFRLVREVLADDGTLWVNMGDSYAATTKGSGGHSPKHDNNVGSWHGNRTWSIPPGLKPKDLVGMPWRLAFALQADGWYLRSDIIWHKPNPMPESVTDRPTKSHEYLFLLSKRAKYYYDCEAIKEPAARAGDIPGGTRRGTGVFGVKPGWGNGEVPAGRSRRTVWTIATASFKDTHFATFPPKLVEPCILAGTRPTGGVVLDPFFGSGTVGQVAESLGRSWIGIELNLNYVEMSKARTAQIGMTL